MPDLDLDAIESRAAAATKGPWEVMPLSDCGRVVGWTIENVLRWRNFTNSINCGEDQATAVFIAHARTDIPVLLAHIQELKDCIAVLVAATDSGGRDTDGTGSVVQADDHRVHYAVVNGSAFVVKVDHA